MFLSDIDAIVFMIDGTDEGRFNIVRDLLNKLNNELNYKTPIAILINKQDVTGAYNYSQLKEYLEIENNDTNFIWTFK